MYGMMEGDNDVAITMVTILGSMVAIIGGLITIQTPKISSTIAIKGTGFISDSRLSLWLPNPITEPSKRAYEIYVLC